MHYELMHSDPTRDQLIRFTGDLLGEASSAPYSRDPTRWHEVRIYRTIGGKYIIEKMGNSSRPDDKIRSTVHVAETAQGAIECLQTTDDDGVIYFTRASREAIEDAIRNDGGLRDAYTVRTID
jgi:hypothetical protein